MNNKTKIIIAIIFLGLFGASKSVQAANHYIRDGGTGSSPCSDWNSACDSLPASLTRGDTYYIADGSYGSYTFDDAVSGTQVITVKKATVSEHGTDVGWQNSYGDEIAEWQPTIKFITNYIVFDGVVGGGPGSWSSGYGFRISSADNIIFVMFSDKYGGPSSRVNVSNIQISHVELSGNSPVTPGWGDGFNATAYQANTSNVTVSYCYTHDFGGPHFKWSNADHITVEYCYAARNASSPDHHGAGFRIDQATDFTLWHNVFEDMVGSGFVGGYDVGIDDVKIYGNVFRWAPGFQGETNTAGPGYGSGVIYSVGASGPITNWKIHNNTFVNLPDKPLINLYNTGSGNEAYNNLFYAIGGNSPAFCGSTTGVNPNCIYGTILHDYSYYSNTSRTFNEVNAQSAGSLNPFVDWQNMDFRLTVPTSAGINLDAPFGVDAYGSMRGTDGVWDRGAYEYVSGGDTTCPDNPLGLVVR